MGKRLDAFLGRGFKTSKFKTMVNLAVSRLAVLKNQRQARFSIARSDVVALLNTSNHDRALLRVEQVIKEQNMFDVFVMLEGYCHLLAERINLIEQHKFCPEELNEAVSTLIYAATRCGEFPELQEIRAIFTSRYGKEFASRAIELRNNCGVNPKIIQKLSTRTSLENKMKVLKEIASDNNIDLPMEGTISDATMEIKDLGQEKRQSSNPSPDPLSPSGVSNAGENMSIHLEEIERSMRGRKYKDVADAAQAAFESAAYAAAAARAAVELSRSESTDPDDPNSPNRRPRKLTATIEPIGSKLRTHGEDSSEDEEMKADTKFKKIYHVPQMKRSFSASSSDSDDGNVDGTGVVGEEGQVKIRDLVFDESDGEDEQKIKMEPSANYPAEFAADNKGSERIEPLDINRRPISVRTRWTH